MPIRWWTLTLAGAAILAGRCAVAQEAPPRAADKGVLERLDALQRQVDDLKARNAELTKRVEQLERESAAAATRAQNRPKPPDFEAMFARVEAIPSPGGDRVRARSSSAREWKTYRVPEGASALPVQNQKLVALLMKGMRITEIAAFDAKSGEWHVQALREPVDGSAFPVVGVNIAAYAIGRHLYAFSAVASRWDVIELEAGAEPMQPRVGLDSAVVQDGDRFYSFDAETGRWVDVDAKRDK